MSRFGQVIALASAGLAFSQGAAHAAVSLSATLAGPLGAPLGSILPFAGAGVLGIAAAAVIAGIFVKRRKS